MDYNKLLTDRMHFGCDGGFEPIVIPSHLFGFQADLVDWALRKGRSAIFASYYRQAVKNCEHALKEHAQQEGLLMTDI